MKIEKNSKNWQQMLRFPCALGNEAGHRTIFEQNRRCDWIKSESCYTRSRMTMNPLVEPDKNIKSYLYNVCGACLVSYMGLCSFPFLITSFGFIKPPDENGL